MQSKSDRAKQFLPFDALKGFREALREKEKVVVDKIFLAEDEQEKINNSLTSVKPGMMVKIAYYNGGQYLELEGIVSKIDIINKDIIIVKKQIKFIYILKLEII